MSIALSSKVVLIVLLAIGGGSLGGLAYYYQSRTVVLNNQVADLSNNANSLSSQMAALQAQIANLTKAVTQLQTVSSQLNQTTGQLQNLEAQLASANLQLQSLQTQLSNELARLQSVESAFNTQLASLNAQLATAQAEISQLKDVVAQLQAQLGNNLCASGKTLPVGELLDLSSALSTIGNGIKDSSLLAVSDINSFLSSSGCNLKFSAMVDDYALNNSLALTDLQTLSAAGAQVVVGPLNSGAAQYLLSFADANHIVLISPSSSSPTLSIPNDYLFRTAPNDAAQSQADARMMMDRGATAIIIVARHDTYGDGIASATAARFASLGGHVVDTILYDTSATDFTAQIATLYNDYQSANATYPNKVAIDVIAFEEFSQFITQVNAQHPSLLNGVLPWFGTDGVAMDPVILGGPTGALVAGVRLPSTLYAQVNNTKTVSFYQRFASAYPAVACDVYCLGGYDDVWLAALATLQVGSYNGTRIQSALLTVASNYYGVTGWLGLDQNGDRIPASYQIWKVVIMGTIPEWVFAGTWDSSTDVVTWVSPP